MRTFGKFAVSTAIASMALAAGTANASAVITSITIKNAIPDYLQVAEVQIFSGATNVALSTNGGTAISSSIYDGNSTPQKAIDGVTGGNFYTNTIFHSAGSGSNEFLTINLSAPTSVDSFTVFGRTDCCGGRDSYTYTLYNGEAVVGSGNLVATGDSHSATAQVEAVPEPATWAMLLLGFGMIGFAMRRRSDVRTTVSYA